MMWKRKSQRIKNALNLRGEHKLATCVGSVEHLLTCAAWQVQLKNNFPPKVDSAVFM